MPAESISVNLDARDNASRQFREVGRAAADSAVKMDLAAASLKLWDDTSVKSGKATDNLIKSKLAVTKADKALADAERFVSGEAGKLTSVLAGQGKGLTDTASKASLAERLFRDLTRTFSGQSKELDNAGKSAASAAGGFSALAGTGGFPGGGIGALVAAGVALSPVIATVGTGLLGFGAAAAGVGAPILKAAQATGGLQANMAKLDPEQRKVAVGLLGLGQQFDVFQKALKPSVLGVFNQGISLAGHLLTDVQPVAKATGTALGVLLGRIDAEFASGAWQQFFQFMARTAGPDIQLLGTTFINLAATLPPLLKLLSPVAQDILIVAAAASKLAQVGAETGQSLDKTAQHENILAQATDALRTVLFAPGVGLYHALKLTGIVGASTGSSLKDAGDSAAVAGPKFFDLTGAVNKLNTSMTTLVGNLLTLQGENVSWRQSMQAAKKQLDSNTAGLAGNSKNALANRAAVIQSSQAAITFANDQLKLGRNIDGASRTVQAQINWLKSLHSNSATVRAEIHALREEEAKLQAQRINQQINVQGLGQWSVSQSLAPGAGHRRATGGRVPGYGGGDRWPALLEGGEAIVPKHLTPAVAPFLRANRVPGFAAGGIIGSYAGNAGGLTPWVQHNDAATIRLIDQAVVSATVAGMRAAQRAAASAAFADTGARSGSAALAQAYARSLLGAYGFGASQMGPLISLWNQESGWNAYAVNPTSGAYGIPQSLGHGHPYNLGDYKAQVAWGLQYIKTAYGSPGAAWAHEVAFNWYDRGGFLPPGVSMAYNGTGRPERVGGGGNSYQITVNVPPGANMAEAGRVTVQAIREFERRSGSGWRN